MDVAPEVQAAIIGGVFSVLVALIALAPLLLRRVRRAVEEDGVATRDALERLAGAFSEHSDDNRDRFDRLGTQVSNVREWQAAHDAEHILLSQQHQRGDDA